MRPSPSLTVITVISSSPLPSLPLSLSLPPFPLLSFLPLVSPPSSLLSLEIVPCLVAQAGLEFLIFLL